MNLTETQIIVDIWLKSHLFEYPSLQLFIRHSQSLQVLRPCRGWICRLYSTFVSLLVSVTRIQLSCFYFWTLFYPMEQTNMFEEKRHTAQGCLFFFRQRLQPADETQRICRNMIKTNASSRGQKSFHLATEYSSISPLNRAMINWTSSVIKIWMSSFQSLNSQGRHKLSSSCLMHESLIGLSWWGHCQAFCLHRPPPWTYRFKDSKSLFQTQIHAFKKGQCCLYLFALSGMVSLEKGIQESAMLTRETV